MKRFLIFCGDTYYPGGGWDDFHSSHDTLEEAYATTETFIRNVGQWWHIVDLAKGEMVNEPNT